MVPSLADVGGPPICSSMVNSGDISMNPSVRDDDWFLTPYSPETK